jgi:cytoskeleton protein RodZ
MADAPQLSLEHDNEAERVDPHSLRHTAVVAHLPVDSSGHDLRKARLRKGKELSDVALPLKIRPDYLNAIEEGRFDALPGRVYALGYVRSYAAYLGLNGQLFVERVKAEIGALGPVVEQRPAEPIPARLPEPKLNLQVIGGLLSVAIIYSAYFAISSLGRTSEPAVTPVPARLAVLTDKQIPQAPSPSPARVEQPAPAEPPSAAVVQPAQAAPRQLPPPPLPDVTPTPPVLLRADLLATVHTVQTRLPAGRRYGVQNRNSRITLRVHRPTHVAVRGTRNRAFIDRALFPGDTYRVPNVAGLRLTTQDGGAVELIVDGSSLGFAGQDGAAASNLSLNLLNVIGRQRG